MKTPSACKIMVTSKFAIIGLIISLSVLFSCVFATETAAKSIAPMKIAADGVANCSIVISANANEAEKYAAKELAYFLGEMTGAEFKTIDDSKPASGSEIVLGNTNRMSMNDVPKSIRPVKQEGFTILRKGSSLFIIGMIPRATLYGVYDMLDMDLGCRFLASKVNYIPKHKNLEINIKSRKYDPPLEYRSIWYRADQDWMVRNGLNSAGQDGIPMEDILGGVRWLLWCHTSANLVPWEEYAKDHPEYYSMIDGKRAPYVNAVKTQLCLTNPDVFKIALKNAKKYIDAANNAYPQAKYSKFLLSVTENDNTNFCQCDECKKVNKEENSSGGTLIRFVNSIARELGKEYKNVEVETLAYGMMRFPPKTAPEKNVLIRWTSGLNDCYPMDSKANAKNWEQYEQLVAWHKVTNRIYRWGYYSDGGSYYRPYPGLDYLDHNNRVQVKNGMLGIFVQGAFDAGADFQMLKNYLFAKILWRPETDGKKTITEFCNLYYGKAGGKILEYLRFLNDNYKDKTSAEDFDEAFIQKADTMFTEAERLADTPETKQRVAIARLSIWKLVIDRASMNQGKVAELPQEWKFCFDENDAGVKEEWFKKSDFSSWAPIKTDASWTTQSEKRLGIGWYETSFDIPDRSGNYVLHFGAVDGLCDIYVDGEKIAEQKLAPEYMWDTPFTVQLPKGIAPGKHNVLVRVEKYACAAGIWKPVSLVDRNTPVSKEIMEACENFLSVGQALPIKMLDEGHTNVDVYYKQIQSLMNYGCCNLCNPAE